MKKGIKEAEDIMNHFSTLTSVIVAIVTLGGLALVFYGCMFNEVYLLVCGLFLLLLCIPLYKLGVRADEWRFA